MLTSILHAFGILGFTLAWLAYDHYRPWVNFHSEALALAGFGLLLMSRFMRQKFSSAASPHIVFWVLAVALLPWLQYVSGISLFAGDALLGSLYLCALGGAIWLGYTYATASPDDGSALAPVFYLLWLAASVSAAIGLLQWLSLQEPFGMYVVQTDASDRAMGNLGQPNQLATLLLVGIASVAWIYEDRRIGRWGAITGIGFMTLGLVLTQSRAGMLSALACAVFLMWKNRVAPTKIAPRYVLAWLLVYGAAVLLLPHVHELLLMGGSRPVNFQDNARITIWRQMLSGISQAPWLGFGWNQTPTAHAAGSLAVAGSITYTNAHNVVLDILAWMGIPLGLLFTGACAYWFVTRIHQATHSNAVYAMACLLPIAVHCMVEYPFAYSYFLIVVGIMVGVVEASYTRIQTIKLNLRWAGAALAAWFVIGGYMVHEYVLIEEDFRVVRFQNLRIGQTPAAYEAPRVLMLSHMGAMLRAARQQAVPDMHAEDLENLRKASLRFPYGSLNLRYAQSLGLNGNPSEATRQMAIIRGMYGEYYYQAAVNVLRTEQEKYPELAQVITP